MKKIFSLLVMILFCQISLADVSLFGSKEENIIEIKKQILALAKSFEGQGDPDQSKQKQLDVWVQRLIQLSPAVPVKDRIPLLAGVWKQVWGPYEYRKDDGSVDPKLGVNEIYQVISEEGYYYNVAPYYPNETRDREQIGLLRGEFQLDSADVNGLRVKFTDYPGVEPRPQEIPIWELAPLAEAGQLKNEITIVPSWIVKLFFGGGKLEEVYTDSELRITYGSNGRSGSKRSLYVLSRIR